MSCLQTEKNYSLYVEDMMSKTQIPLSFAQWWEKECSSLAYHCPNCGRIADIYGSIVDCHECGQLSNLVVFTGFGKDLDFIIHHNGVSGWYHGSFVKWPTLSARADNLPELLVIMSNIVRIEKGL